MSERMRHLRFGGTPLSTSPHVRPLEKMKVVRGRADREAQRVWEPAVQENVLDKDALLEWGDRWSDRGRFIWAQAEARAELSVGDGI